jgi:hypothetical protein
MHGDPRSPSILSGYTGASNTRRTPTVDRPVVDYERSCSFIVVVPHMRFTVHSVSGLWRAIL